MRTLERSDLERQRYWLGQRLKSRDLDDQLADEAERRWWHNRALHRAYGVARGFETAIEGDGTLTVCPGVAYDCYGRELVLAAPRRIVRPAKDRADGWTLIVRRGPAGAAELHWWPGTRPEPAAGVPLLRLDVRRSPGERPPLARPLARPRIAHGVTVAGKTPWREWNVGPHEASGVEVTVDTSAGGFIERPCYFAWLRGGPLRPPLHGVPLEIGRIIRATPESFTFRLWLWRQSLPSPPAQLPGDSFADLARRQLSLCWLAVEHERPADPIPCEVENGTA